MSGNPSERLRRPRSPTFHPHTTLERTTPVKKFKAEDPPDPVKLTLQTSAKKKKNKDKPSQGLVEKLGDAPLRLIIVGHNPSEHAWKSGHYYSNPSNRMWKILKSTKIAPEKVKSAEDDDLMLSCAGVGFTDIGCGIPGTDRYTLLDTNTSTSVSFSSQFSFKIRREWSLGFLKRLKAHIDRCNAALNCSCGECGAPRILAFAGKSHFHAVHNSTCEREDRIKKATIGRLEKVAKASAPC